MCLITKHSIIISSTQRSWVLQFIGFARCAVWEGLCFDLVSQYKEWECFYGISEQKWHQICFSSLRSSAVSVSAWCLAKKNGVMRTAALQADVNELSCNASRAQLQQCLCSQARQIRKALKYVRCRTKRSLLSLLTSFETEGFRRK